MKIRRSAVLVCMLAAAAEAYAPQFTSNGTAIRRTDAANVKLMVNQAVAPGMLNSQGSVMIQTGSDPAAALQAAANAWSSAPASIVKFAPIETTPAVNNPDDDRSVIVFLDSPENRSVIGSALAVTDIVFLSDGKIVETDILFNPAETFSTNLTPKTFDLQSVAIHEMGHALGANHSNILAATMFQATPPQSNSQVRLSADDIAFLSEFYPAPAAAEAYGTLSGKVTFAGGGPVQGAMLVATDPTTGVTIGGFSAAADGAYSIKVPHGAYLLYAEPADGPVFPGNLYLPDEKVNFGFQTSFYGGLAAPQLVDVTGSQATADLQVTPGAAAFDIQLLGTGSAAGSGDARISTGVSVLTAGRPVDLILSGPGLEGPVTQDMVRLLGPGLAIRPDSIRIDTRISINGVRPLRLTIDVGGRTEPAVGSVVVIRNGAAVALSGSLLIQPPRQP
ncbi:MAG TPA: matrixin family metalloprotease [Bryobacteraceae bacterium]|nr:matrixin family metalloprotease [Bryobacteraceae bacterium]